MPELPDPDPATIPHEYELHCRYRQRVLKVPDFIIGAHPTAGEQYSFLSDVADAKGWGYGKDWIGGELQGVFVCPEHVKQDAEALARVLPRFNPNSTCAACGSGNATTRHCHGRVSTCELGAPRLHLHRECPNCKFEWIEGRLDDPLTK